MLLIGRKEQEKLTIMTPDGEVIKITITKCQYKRVVLGIEAPDDFNITRDELLPDME